MSIRHAFPFAALLALLPTARADESAPAPALPGCGRTFAGTTRGRVRKRAPLTGTVASREPPGAPVQGRVGEARDTTSHFLTNTRPLRSQWLLPAIRRLLIEAFLSQE